MTSEPLEMALINFYETLHFKHILDVCFRIHCGGIQKKKSIICVFEPTLLYV